MQRLPLDNQIIALISPVIQEMKIGGGWTQETQVYLPSELIELILYFVSIDNSSNRRKRTLWSCCLLSKAWYSASIPHLYERPDLTSKNFDVFARTICPPVNARVRRVGLEDLVHHLDMGRLAYESTRSLTARLIRRTRASLESFTAPAVSFSISSLAPLSKCTNLATLDLSRDFYDIDISQLLHSLGNLPKLWRLSLPKAALRRRSSFRTKSGACPWPATLTHLQVNDWLPNDELYWKEFIESWPPSLTSLVLEDCFNYDPLWMLSNVAARSERILHLNIGVRRCEESFPLSILYKTFPLLKTLTIPAPTLWLLGGLPAIVLWDSLEHLTLQESRDVVMLKAVTTSDLCHYADVLPNLCRIDMPESYLDFVHEESANDVDDLDDTLTKRAPGRNFLKDPGVFLHPDMDMPTGLRRGPQFPGYADNMYQGLVYGITQ